jgi:hypothetical protein
VSEWQPEQPFGIERVFYVDPHKFLTEYQASDVTATPSSTTDTH